jgi:hypothetical protein
LPCSFRTTPQRHKTPYWGGGEGIRIGGRGSVAKSLFAF